MHPWAMDVFKYLVPTLMVSVESTIVIALFVAIRAGFSNQYFIALFSMSIGMISLFSVMYMYLFAAKMSEMSAKFIASLGSEAVDLKIDKLVAVSCAPVKIKIGSTFTVSQQTLPTVLKDVIIGNLINLLVTFK